MSAIDGEEAGCYIPVLTMLEALGFPPHAASLTLTHNDHLDVYETVAMQLLPGGPLASVDWVSDEQRALACERNECWTLQWYPDTPIGFHALAAADLDVLLAAARKL